MKKTLLFFTLILWVFLGNAQTTQTVKLPLKLENVALGSTKDSILVIGVDGVVRRIKTSSIAGNTVDLNSAQTIRGEKSFKNDIILGTYADPDFNFGALNTTDGVKLFSTQGNNNYISQYGHNGISFSRNGFVQSIEADFTGANANARLKLPKGKSGTLALTSDLSDFYTKAETNTQLDTKVDIYSSQRINGTKTFTGLTNLGITRYVFREGGVAWLVSGEGANNENFTITDDNGKGLRIVGNEILTPGCVLIQNDSPTEVNHVVNKQYVDNKLDAGTYIPRISNTSTLTVVNASNFFYTRVGNIITVTGAIDLVANNAIASFTIALPVIQGLSNFTSANDVLGVASASNSGATPVSVVKSSYTLFPVNEAYVQVSLGELTNKVSVTFSYELK